MKKRFMSLLLVAVMALTLVPLEAFATTNTAPEAPAAAAEEPKSAEKKETPAVCAVGPKAVSGSWEYKELSDGTIMLTGTAEEVTGELYLPSTIGGKKVTVIGDYAFSEGQFNAVRFGKYLREIGYAAFNACPNLRTVVIPDSVVTLGKEAFGSCRMLTEMDFGQGVTNMSYRVCYDCPVMKKLTLGQQVKTIGTEAFAYCGSLRSVEFPSTLETIGSRAFAACDRLVSVTLGDYINSIGSGAFQSCDLLETVDLGNSVESIGEGCFSTCASLTSINVPDSVTSIGREAFFDCDSLTEAHLGDGITHIPFNTFCWCGSLTDVTLGKGLESIGERAFCQCGSLKTVRQSGKSNNLKIVGESAFYECAALETVDLGGGVEKIMSSAFNGCTSLTNLHAGTNLRAISGGAFSNCSKLTDMNLGDKLETIGDGAFSSCDGLKSLYLPDSVRSIGERSFSGCDGLTDIQVGDGLFTLSQECFGGCDNLQYVYLGANVSKISMWAICNGSSLRWLTLPDTLQSVGTEAFDGDTKLQSVYYGGSQQEWGNVGISDQWEDNDELRNAALVPYSQGPGTELRVDQASTGRPHLEWDAVPGASAYQVYYSNNPWVGFELLTTQPDTTLTHSTADLGMLCYYRVRPVIGGVPGEYSRIEYTTCTLGRPDVKVAANADGKPVLTWNPIDGAQGYLVYYCVDDGEFQKLITVSGTTLRHGSAKSGHTYTYKVCALADNSEGNSSWSDYDTITVKITKLGVPTLTVTNTSSNGKPYLKWTAVSGADKYEIYYSTSKTGTYKRLFTASGTTLKHGSAKAGTTYYYKVRAITNGGAKGEFSPYKLRTCDLARPDVKLTTRSGHPYLYWKKISGAVKYDVYCSVDGGSFTRLLGVKSTHLTHSSAKRGHTYRYRVKAIASRSSANSAYSYYDTITVK